MIFADDTRPETREVLIQLLRSQSESERALHGFRLWNSFKNRVMNSIRTEKPDIDAIELLVEAFRRIYQNDFTPDEMERICERIRKYHQARGNNQHPGSSIQQPERAFEPANNPAVLTT